MNSSHSSRPSLPLLGFAAYSGTGKTTLLEALVPKLTAAGLRLGILKHAHHNFDVDKPGKDSYRLRKAGASPDADRLTESLCADDGNAGCRSRV